MQATVAGRRVESLAGAGWRYGVVDPVLQRRTRLAARCRRAWYELAERAAARRDLRRVAADPEKYRALYAAATSADDRLAALHNRGPSHSRPAWEAQVRDADAASRNAWEAVADYVWG